MSIISISLPKEQVDATDYLVSKYGFANRSEFVRSLLRFINYKPSVLEEAVSFPFVSPTKKSVNKIMADFKKEKKYSAEFLKDLEEGLRESDYFID